MAQKKMTIEDLAEVIQRTMASKEDLGEVKTKLEKMREGLQEVVGEMSSMREDIHYVRNSMSTLVQSDTAQDAAIGELDTRVNKLEQKAGVGA